MTIKLCNMTSNDHHIFCILWGLISVLLSVLMQEINANNEHPFTRKWHLNNMPLALLFLKPLNDEIYLFYSRSWIVVISLRVWLKHSGKIYHCTSIWIRVAHPDPELELGVSQLTFRTKTGIFPVLHIWWIQNKTGYFPSSFMVPEAELEFSQLRIRLQHHSCNFPGPYPDMEQDQKFPSAVYCNVDGLD